MSEGKSILNRLESRHPQRLLVPSRRRAEYRPPARSRYERNSELPSDWFAAAAWAAAAAVRQRIRPADPRRGGPGVGVEPLRPADVRAPASRASTDRFFALAAIGLRRTGLPFRSVVGRTPVSRRERPAATDATTDRVRWLTRSARVPVGGSPISRPSGSGQRLNGCPFRRRLMAACSPIHSSLLVLAKSLISAKCIISKKTRGQPGQAGARARCGSAALAAFTVSALLSDGTSQIRSGLICVLVLNRNSSAKNHASLPLVTCDPVLRDYPFAFADSNKGKTERKKRQNDDALRTAATSESRVFAINELPDLAGKVQVGLFNIMQEGDVQIKGYRSGCRWTCCWSSRRTRRIIRPAAKL